MGNTEHRSTNIALLVAVLSLFAGILVVIFELRQAQNIALTQLVQADITMNQTEMISRYGENVAGSIARACDETENLSSIDAYKLDALFRYQMNWIGRQKFQQLGTLAGITWQDTARRRMGFILGFPNGKKWIRTYESRDAEINAYVQENVENVEPVSCKAVQEIFRGDA